MTQARLVFLVFLGGCLGTAAREAIVLAQPPVAGVPWAILTVNLTGAFALGLLLGMLGMLGARGTRRDETTPGRDVRLFVGTGFLGGFTTYSALATDTALLLETKPGIGAAYAIGSVVAGIALAALGVVAGGALARRRRSPA